jgi:hypothetical protein
MEGETVIRVIDALIGDIKPYGSPEINNERLGSLQVLLEVMDNYIGEIAQIVKYRNRSEYFKQTMGEMAYEWFVDLKDYVNEFMEE